MSDFGRFEVKAAGRRIHAEVRGAGPPVLVLHGFTGSCASMAGTAARLADRHRVVSIDLIGHGRSASPADGDAYTMERCVEQIAATLDGLAVPSAHVVGYSMGGRTALALATWRPGRVRSLVLVGASAGLEDEAERAARRSHDEALADSIERDGIEAFVDRWMALPLFASQARLGAEWLARARRQRLANDPVGLALSLRGMGTGAQPPLHACLGSLEAPVCWVAGDEDAKFTKLAEALAPRCRDGRVCIVPGSGHACHLEQPEAFAEIARKHIETAEQGRNPS